MTDHQYPEDAVLMQMVRQRNQQALSLLYDRYVAQVYGLVYRILNNGSMAEEVTQDTFMKVWKQPDRWDDAKGRFSSWLLTIARNTAIDHLRRERRQVSPETASLDVVAEPPSPFGLPHDSRRLDANTIRGLLDELPFEQAHAIELAFFQGMTHRELAEHLDLPLGTVKTRVRLGLQKLKALWLAQEHD